MKTLHKFLIPRLDLDQGGVVRQLQRVHGHDLKPRQMPLRAAYGGVTVLCKHRMAVIHAAQRGLAHPSPGAAPAQRPGGTMAGQRLLAEPLDVAIVHILEEIPRFREEALTGHRPTWPVSASS